MRAGMASTMPAERDLRRVIGDGETIPDGEVEGVGEQELLALYRSMVLLRTYDERSVVYHSQGRIGTYAIFWGHEAIQAGAVHALEDDDWIFPSYRESAIGLLRGMPPATILSWWRGHPAGWWNPADYNLASICVPIATQVPHAAGLAWGKRLRGETACALTFFGDGATSEGAFHEGANFAAVMRAPLVLLCNNNQWAISTPLSAQTRAEALVDKAAGYGIPGARVDGGDVLAVYEAARDAVARARAGDGPTFIEAVTYRSAPHATADDPKAYIDAERVEEERANECVGRFAGYLRRQGILHDALDQQIKAEAADAMRAGIAAAEAEPPADIGLVFEHALADPPASFEHDLAELRRILGELSCSSSRRSTTRCTSRWSATPDVLVMGEDVGRAGGVFRATAGLRDRFGPTAASTLLSPRRASSARRWGSAWPATGPCARCSTTRSRTPASTS